jgi:gamma-glutamylaminecyclotransferase
VADSTLLFVYGSLKRGRRHHAELGGARFVGVARTAPEYRLLDLGEYPALAAGCRAIEGELYEVTEALLVELDRFEGDGYDRGVLHLSDGGTALAYFATPELTRRAPELDGDAW